MHQGAAFMRRSYCSSDFCFPKRTVLRSFGKSRVFLFPIAAQNLSPWWKSVLKLSDTSGTSLEPVIISFTKVRSIAESGIYLNNFGIHMFSPRIPMNPEKNSGFFLLLLLLFVCLFFSLLGREIFHLQILRPILDPFLILKRWLLWISISSNVVIFIFFVFLFFVKQFALLFVQPKPMTCRILSHNFNNLCQLLSFLNSSFSLFSLHPSSN